MLGNIDISFGDRLKESRFPASVLSQKTVSLTVVQTDLSALNQKTSVERQGVGVDLDITSFDIRDQNSVCGSEGR